MSERPQNKFLKPCKPGECPPGGGRPKGSLNRSTLARRWLEAAGENGVIADDITLAAIKKAKGGDIPAYLALMDAAYGKLVEKSEVAVTELSKGADDVAKRYVERAKGK